MLTAAARSAAFLINYGKNNHGFAADYSVQNAILTQAQNWSLIYILGTVDCVA
jgi:hypothetical protein